jgi:hypothetical protein
MSAAWRQPIVWLMCAIPLATVVAGFATLRTARADAMDAEPDAVKRTAQAQVADLAPDRRAAELGLHATIRVDADGRPAIAVASEFPLTLRLVHPTRTDRDLRWTLLPRRPREGGGPLDSTSLRVGPRFRGGDKIEGPRVPAHARGRWVLEDAAHGWRLVGRWPSDTGVATLEPAVAAR